MRVASVCSSVGGLDLGLHRAGHRTVFLCEFDAWRRTVLNRHFPGVPVHPDMKELRAHDIPECDLFVGGTPCQDLSVAGKRAGLDGERSGLFHKFAQLRLDLFHLHGTAWSLWENVAGALSSNDGRDFATVLASHVGADVAVPAGGWPGSGVASGPWGAAEWRLLDAQFFGVPQRRRRVFVVGHLGAVHAPEVLADAARRQGHSQTSGQARPSAAGRTARGAEGAGRVAHTLTANGFDASEDGTGRGTPLVAAPLLKRGAKGVDSDASDGQVVVAGTMPARGKTGGYDVDPSMAADGYLQVTATLTSGSHADGVSAPGRRQEDEYNLVGVSFAENQRGEIVENDIARSVTGGGGKPGQGYPAARTEKGVRRLTPTECERLMSWPDGWTLPHGPSLADAPQSWPTAGVAPVDPQPDGRRYSACGDGVVANVATWIGLGFPILNGQEAAA